MRMITNAIATCRDVLILRDCDMTCHLMKVLIWLHDAVLFPVSSYPTTVRAPSNVNIFHNRSHYIVPYTNLKLHHYSLFK